MYSKVWKRLIDIIVSGIGMIILAIPMGIVALIIMLEDHGPAIFAQKRVGIHKTYFHFYKFRSMKVSTPDVATHLLTNPEKYITRIGRIIRKTSIDELPQLWNVFKGDMSLIGPRPALWNQEDLVAEREKYGANDVLPGLTGWAQINGRDRLEIREKAKLDGEYVQKRSFLFDCKCMLGTLAAVIRTEDVIEGTADLQDADSREDVQV